MWPNNNTTNTQTHTLKKYFAKIQIREWIAYSSGMCTHGQYRYRLQLQWWKVVVVVVVAILSAIFVRPEIAFYLFKMICRVELSLKCNQIKFSKLLWYVRSFVCFRRTAGGESFFWMCTRDFVLCMHLFPFHFYSKIILDLAGWWFSIK